jgi:hypothetical protein
MRFPGPESLFCELPRTKVTDCIDPSELIQRPLNQPASLEFLMSRYMLSAVSCQVPTNACDGDCAGDGEGETVLMTVTVLVPQPMRNKSATAAANATVAFMTPPVHLTLEVDLPSSNGVLSLFLPDRRRKDPRVCRHFMRLMVTSVS